MIVIEEGDAAAFRLDDVALVLCASPNIGSVKSGFAAYVHKLHR